MVQYVYNVNRYPFKYQNQRKKRFLLKKSTCKAWHIPFYDTYLNINTENWLNLYWFFIKCTQTAIIAHEQSQNRDLQMNNKYNAKQNKKH